MPPPIAADLRPCADGSAVRKALMVCSAAALPVAYGAAGLGTYGAAGLGARLGQPGQTDRQTDGRIGYRLMPPTAGA